MFAVTVFFIILLLQLFFPPFCLILKLGFWLGMIFSVLCVVAIICSVIMEPFAPSVFFPELSTYVQSYTLFYFFFNASAQADADLKTEIINFLPPPDILLIFFLCSADSSTFYHTMCFTSSILLLASWSLWHLLVFCSQTYSMCCRYLITCLCYGFVDLSYFKYS